MAGDLPCQVERSAPGRTAGDLGRSPAAARVAAPSAQCWGLAFNAAACRRRGPVARSRCGRRSGGRRAIRARSNGPRLVELSANSGRSPKLARAWCRRGPEQWHPERPRVPALASSSEPGSAGPSGGRRSAVLGRSACIWSSCTIRAIAAARLALFVHFRFRQLPAGIAWRQVVQLSDVSCFSKFHAKTGQKGRFCPRSPDRPGTEFVDPGTDNVLSDKHLSSLSPCPRCPRCNTVRPEIICRQWMISALF